VLHDVLACKMAPKALPCNFAPGLYSIGAAHAAGRGADWWGHVAGGGGGGGERSDASLEDLTRFSVNGRRTEGFK
jgi:hypothetical protein